MKVTILMSTYNGENFLAEQIESIQQQTYTDWTLLIRDDGSKDKTREIIKRFALEDDRITFINPDQTENLGVIKINNLDEKKYQDYDSVVLLGELTGKDAKIKFDQKEKII